MLTIGYQLFQCVYQLKIFFSSQHYFLKISNLFLIQIFCVEISFKYTYKEQFLSLVYFEVWYGKYMKIGSIKDLKYGTLNIQLLLTLCCKQSSLNYNVRLSNIFGALASDRKSTKFSWITKICYSVCSTY
jgi:hypothetical protein